MTDEVLFEVAGGVARVTINRPERRNAMSYGVMQRAARRDGARPCRRDGAGRGAHRRGRQGVLRGRRSRAASPRTPARRRARGPRAPRRPVPRHVVARQADRWRGCAATRSPADSGSACACDMIVAADDAVFGTPGDQRRPVALHDHGSVAALDAAQDRARSDDDGPARLGRRGRAHRVRAAGRARRRARRHRRRARRRPRGEVAADHAVGPRRLLPRARDGCRRRALVSPGHVDRSRRRPRTRPRASPRSPRSARRNGRADDGSRYGMADERHDWGPLVGDLAEAHGARARDGWRRARRARSARSASSPCASASISCSIPGSWVEYGLLADHMDAGLGDRYLAADGAITGIGEIDGRPVAVAAYDFTVMAGSMGGVGEDKITAAARARGAPAHAVRVAARLRGRAHPVDVGIDVRGRGRAVPRAGRDERRGADGRGDARALRGRHRVHSRRSPTSCRW